VAISEVSGTTTNVLMDQRRAAFTAGGKFSAALKGNFSPADSSIATFKGTLQGQVE
jgi:hypothetical protein